MDESLWPGTGHRQQEGLRDHQRRPPRERNACCYRSTVRARRRREGPAGHRSARHAARTRHAAAHRPATAGAATLQDLLSGRMHGGLPRH